MPQITKTDSHSRRMSRIQQIELGKKIQVLVQKKIGSNFSSEFQGGGKVAFLTLTASNRNFVGRIRHYLTKDIGLVLQQPLKNHGAGMKNTLLISLSEINSDKITVINNLFRPLFEAEKKSQSKNGLDKNESLPGEPSQLEAVVPSSSVPVEADIILSHDRPTTDGPKAYDFAKRIKSFLQAVIGYEMTTVFQNHEPIIFMCNFDEKYVTVRLEQAHSKMAEGALKWLVGADFVIREGNDVVVNFSGAEIRKIEPRTYYCPPPTHSRSEMINEKLRRVKSGTIPSVKKIGASLFEVSYKKKGISNNILEAIIEMGWQAKTKDDHSFVVKVTDEKPPKTISPVIPVIPEPVQTIVSDSKTEALAKLQTLFEDKEKFSRLSDATRKEISDFLKENKEKKELEDYARSLLNLLKK